jgi:hypothetical protein
MNNKIKIKKKNKVADFVVQKKKKKLWYLCDDDILM